jgi:hypothetical protein
VGCLVEIDRELAVKPELGSGPERLGLRQLHRFPSLANETTTETSEMASPGKKVSEAVSDRGGGVRSRDERPPARGAQNHRR